MKRTIIFSAFMAILLSAVFTSAQGNVRLTFSEAISPSGVPTGTVRFFVDGAPLMQVFEAVIPAATEAACFASRDFSTARPVGPDRASVTYYPAIGSYQLRWTGVRDRRDSCRVLLVGQTVASSDLAVWQSNYGATRPSNRDDITYGRGVYKLFLNDASTSSSLSVTYPNQDGEVVEVGFPDAANSNFRLLERSFPARSDAECVANGDFSGAIPVVGDRATIGYFPSSGLWQVRNSYMEVTTVQCHALLIDGDQTVDAGDYTLWRSRFGSSIPLAGGDGLLKDAGDIDENDRQSIPGGNTVYTVTVSNTGPSLR